MSNGSSTFKKVFEIFICLIVVVGGTLYLFIVNRKSPSHKVPKAPVETTSTMKYTVVGKALKKLRSTDKGYLEVKYFKQDHLLVFTVISPHYLGEIQDTIVPNQTKWFSEKIHKRVKSQFIVPSYIKQKAKGMINKQKEIEKQRYKNKQLKSIEQKQQQLNKKNQELKKQNARNKQNQQKKSNYFNKHHKNNKNSRRKNQRKRNFNRKNKKNQRHKK